MRLFLIEQDVNTDYDVFDAAVVVAESEEAARRMLPSFYNFALEEDEGQRLVWWVRSEDVKVTYLGEAALNGPCCVMSSFNAG